MNQTIIRCCRKTHLEEVLSEIIWRDIPIVSTMYVGNKSTDSGTTYIVVGMHYAEIILECLDKPYMGVEILRKYK